MEPYITKYANLSTLQDHSRTKLLELWNQKTYMRTLKCHHETRNADGAADTRIIFRGMVNDHCVLEVPFDKDAKNKVRSFYKHYFRLISGFFEDLEKTGQHLAISADSIIKKIEDYRKKKFKLKDDD